MLWILNLGRHCIPVVSLLLKEEEIFFGSQESFSSLCLFNVSANLKFQRIKLFFSFSLARQPRSHATFTLLRRHPRPRLQTRSIGARNLSSRRPRRMRFSASSIQRQPTQVRSLWANAVQTRIEVKSIWSHQNSRESCEKQ